MEQSDLDLLQTVPPYHIQAVVKARHVQSSLKQEGVSASGTLSAINTPNMLEIAQALFNPSSIHAALSDLNGLEKIILR
ncbi:MAG TPA: hypothetical protein VGT82_06185, partial [Ktedonobacteraceae bacterium]|nr:hypothetical protein [Ktedonobacteraceae bacterium]